MDKNVPVRKNMDQRTGMSNMPTSVGPLDRLWDSFFGEDFGLPSFNLLRSRLPRSNIQETEDSYYLTAEVPGVSQKDIEINVSGNVLSIHAEHKEEENEKERSYRRNFQFHQSYTLPNTVDAEKIEAHAENGFLEVLIPKTASSKMKQIEVQSGKGGFWNRITGKENKKSSEQKDVKH